MEQKPRLVRVEIRKDTTEMIVRLMVREGMSLNDLVHKALWGMPGKVPEMKGILEKLFSLKLGEVFDISKELPEYEGFDKEKRRGVTFGIHRFLDMYYGYLCPDDRLIIRRSFPEYRKVSLDDRMRPFPKPRSIRGRSYVSQLNLTPERFEEFDAMRKASGLSVSDFVTHILLGSTRRLEAASRVFTKFNEIPSGLTFTFPELEKLAQITPPGWAKTFRYSWYSVFRDSEGIVENVGSQTDRGVVSTVYRKLGNVPMERYDFYRVFKGV